MMVELYLLNRSQVAVIEYPAEMFQPPAAIVWHGRVFVREWPGPNGNGGTPAYYENFAWFAN